MERERDRDGKMPRRWKEKVREDGSEIYDTSRPRCLSHPLYLPLLQSLQLLFLAMVLREDRFRLFLLRVLCPELLRIVTDVEKKPV